MDRTFRKRAAEGDPGKLRSRLLDLSGQTFVSLVENSTNLIGISTLEGELIYLNPAGRRQLGFDDAPLPEGFRVQDFAFERHRGKLQYMLQLLSRMGRWTGEMRVKHPFTGESIPIEVRAFLIRDPEDGAPIGMAGIGRDLSDRKRVEKALRLSEEKFAKAFRITPDAVNINRMRDGLYVEINEGFTRATGYEVEDVIGKSSLDLNIWHDPAERDELIRRLKEHGEVLNFEAKFRRKDGRIGTGLMSARILDIDGEKYILSITRDITDRIRLEEQLRQAQKMEAVGRLAGGIAHDFNNLLTVIVGYCDVLLARTKPGDPGTAELQEIRKAGESASALTRQLLAFGRKQVLNLRPTRMNELVAQMENMLRRTIGENIALSTDLAPDLWTVRADAHQLQQVVMNLAINARDAMPSGGRLSIGTRNVLVGEDAPARPPDCPPGHYAVLSAEDTGCGMDEAVLREIFEPFFTTKEPGKGSGLGLSTVHGIVRQSGGFVEVESRPGHGTTFRVYLPRVEPPPAADAAPNESLGRAGGGNETILLVEDSEVVRSYTAEILRTSGYDVLEAASGEEAIRAAGIHARPIDLLLSDVVMPGITGGEVASRIRAIRPGTKVLFVSGYPEDAIGGKRLIEDGTPFLGKPFTPNELLKKIRETLAS
jgi:PAS domain S-box-containing protein